MEKRYDIFISYSRHNLDEVKAIKTEIEQTTGARCWMDLEGIESGAPRFTQAIIDGIEQCKIFLFMRSEQSQNSKYALLELSYASEESPETHVVIVNIDSSPMTKEFRFLYRLTDTIDWNNPPQRAKLFRDLGRWIDKPEDMSSTSSQSASVSDWPYAYLPNGILLNNGRYRIEATLSSSGFWNTYRVIDIASNRRRIVREFFLKDACKRNTGSLTVEIEMNHSFVNELQSRVKNCWKNQMQLSHPNIERVVEIFNDNGTVYGVMDPFEGETLASHYRRTGQPLGENIVRRIAYLLMDVLNYIHKWRILHLDIKPANIMIDSPLSNICLIDFSCSKNMDDDDDDFANAYTPNYAPTEQINQGNIGPWTDIYAAGATFYNLLTSLVPPSFSEIVDKEDDAFTFPDSVSHSMRQLIIGMMKPRTKDRFQSAQEVMQYIERKCV